MDVYPSQAYFLDRNRQFLLQICMRSCIWYDVSNTHDATIVLFKKSQWLNTGIESVDYFVPGANIDCFQFFFAGMLSKADLSLKGLKKTNPNGEMVSAQSIESMLFGGEEKSLHFHLRNSRKVLLEGLLSNSGTDNAEIETIGR